MKALSTAWVIALTLYAPVELSRVIIAYGLQPALVFELCFVWGFYLCAVLSLIKLVRIQ